MRIPHHPGRFLKMELAARGVSASRLAIDLGIPPARISDIVNAKRGITVDTAIRLGLYFGTTPQFWLDFQAKHDIAVAMRDKGRVIAHQVRIPRKAA
jgi:addiction module HigA family antidote